MQRATVGEGPALAGSVPCGSGAGGSPVHADVAPEPARACLLLRAVGSKETLEEVEINRWFFPISLSSPRVHTRSQTRLQLSRPGCAT